MELTFQFERLTSNYLPLIRVLQKQKKNRKKITISDVVAYTKKDWGKLINKQVDGKKVGVPDDIKGGNTPDRQKNYIRTLMRNTERAYPTHTVINRIHKQSGVKKDLKRFLPGPYRLSLGRLALLYEPN